MTQRHESCSNHVIIFGVNIIGSPFPIFIHIIFANDRLITYFELYSIPIHIVIGKTVGRKYSVSGAH